MKQRDLKCWGAVGALVVLAISCDAPDDIGLAEERLVERCAYIRDDAFFALSPPGSGHTTRPFASGAFGCVRYSADYDEYVECDVYVDRGACRVVAYRRGPSGDDVLGSLSCRTTDPEDLILLRSLGPMSTVSFYVAPNGTCERLHVTTTTTRQPTTVPTTRPPAPPPPPPPPPPRPTRTFAGDVWPLIEGCSVCHDGRTLLSLRTGDAYRNLTTLTAREGCFGTRLVAPRSPESSVFYRRLTGTSCGRQMGALSLEQQRIVREWILDGALP